ncbi:MAG TPA: hypothetical protein VHE55_15740 [Fimbriimonadaceae bacterium]|nr:hypothetical protein [Fimbriimonadaceae bacterium]
MLVGVPMVAAAQQGDDKLISIDMQNADVREALRTLFKSVGLSYSVAPEVQGTVTLDLHNAKFETALQNICKQVDATYRITAGVYEIIHREDPVLRDPGPEEMPTSKPSTEMRRIRLLHADPMFVAMLIGQSKTDFMLAPEVSTVLKTKGGGGGFGNGLGGGNNSGNNSGNNFGNRFGSGNNGSPGGNRGDGGPRG